MISVVPLPRSRSVIWWPRLPSVVSTSSIPVSAMYFAYSAARSVATLPVQRRRMTSSGMGALR